MNSDSSDDPGDRIDHDGRSEPRLQDIPTRQSRRALLQLGGGSLALVTAGCIEAIGFGGDGEEGRSDGTTDDTPTSPKGTGSRGTGSDLTAWGPTIPTYPYRETESQPLNAKPDPDALNPVLTSGHVTDVNAEFIADPFMFVEDGEWDMFFEVFAGRGRIAHANSDDRGKTWRYNQIVVERQFHISFPQVFKWKGEYYMTTEEESPVRRLYRATEFPTEWEEVDRLYNVTHFGSGNVTDHALFRWNNKWWSITGGDSNTYLFYANSLVDGDWSAHEKNPVVENRPTAARPAGRPIVWDDNVLVFYQDVKQYYGHRVRAYRITDLSPSAFADHEVDASPVLEPTEEGGSWNSHRMHHYEPWYLGDGEGWRIAVDGDKSGNDWAIGIYRTE